MQTIPDCRIRLGHLSLASLVFQGPGLFWAAASLLLVLCLGCGGATSVPVCLGVLCH